MLSACGAPGHQATAKLMQIQNYGKGVAGILRQKDFLALLSFFNSWIQGNIDHYRSI